VTHALSIRSPAAADPTSAPLTAPTHSRELDATLPVSLTVRLVTLFGVIVPFLGLAAAVSLLWGWGFSWVHLGLLIGMYVATALGVTVGFHRLFTHRSFETNAVVKFIFAALGSMAMEGPVLKWVAMHRRHHQHSDGAHDPHSPHHHGEGLRGVLAGFWHAHVGWIFDPDPADLPRYVGDLAPDRVVRSVSRTWMLWSAAGLLIPALLGGLITMSWKGALLGFVWGGLARVFLVHHVTWSINSVCHLWGTRPFRSHDESRNNAVFGVLGLGEGWHNNHHAFPTSARHGLRWWEFDASYLVIRALERMGLAWKVRIPAAKAMAAKRRGRRPVAATTAASD
jgi:stearoyl-CoA desaturase (delta-9 desaturase)